jgi:hypothetical protein
VTPTRRGSGSGTGSGKEQADDDDDEGDSDEADAEGFKDEMTLLLDAQVSRCLGRIIDNQYRTRRDRGTR